MLVDTNVLLRALQPRHPQFTMAFHALQALPKRGAELQVAPQILVELWAVMTRPTDVNGLGWNTSVAEAEIERIESFFTVLPETAALYPAWKRLVVAHGVSGKPTHDARLVAAAVVHRVVEILTFDATGFRRYPEIQVVHPTTV